MKRALRDSLRRIPVFGDAAAWLVRRLRRGHASWARRPFTGAADYWEQRYREGGTSGAGSYGQLAEYKAQVLNAFVDENDIHSVIEFGCGDGHQLSLARYPDYTGFDVAPASVEKCEKLFREDETKRFFIFDPLRFADAERSFQADLALSLDVIFHLTENDAYEAYMHALFSAADRYVIIYSSDRDEPIPGTHVRHREFSTWVREHCPEWSLTGRIDNPYAYDSERADETSFAEFYIFAKSG